MALRLPLCLFNLHAPQRKRVKWDGLNFVGTCRFCRRDIRKQHRGNWRKDWLDDSEHGKPMASPAAPPHATDETRAD